MMINEVICVSAFASICTWMWLLSMGVRSWMYGHCALLIVFQMFCSLVELMEATYRIIQIWFVFWDLIINGEFWRWRGLSRVFLWWHLEMSFSWEVTKGLWYRYVTRSPAFDTFQTNLFIQLVFFFLTLFKRFLQLVTRLIFSSVFFAALFSFFFVRGSTFSFI